MNKRLAIVLMLIGLVIIGLAVGDYATGRRRSRDYADQVRELVDSYRFGTADRPLEDEWAVIEAYRDREKARALIRMQAACLAGIIVLTIGLVFVVGTGRTRAQPSS